MGFTRSIYFMLGMVVLVVPGSFGLLLWNAYRTDRRRADRGESYQPRGGALRWTDGDE
ncbi:MAG: hypothetical protein V3T22_08930 [Planctomycetota bacterium]